MQLNSVPILYLLLLAYQVFLGLFVIVLSMPHLKVSCYCFCIPIFFLFPHTGGTGPPWKRRTSRHNGTKGQSVLKAVRMKMCELCECDIHEKYDLRQDFVEICFDHESVLDSWDSNFTVISIKQGLLQFTQIYFVGAVLV